MSKGSGRRKENAALVEANWPFPDRKADQALADQMREDNLAAAKREIHRKPSVFGVWGDVTGALAREFMPRAYGLLTGERVTEQDAKDGN